MLERTCRMIGDDLAVMGTLRDEARARQILADVHSKPRYTGRGRRMSRVETQHEAIVLERGATARSRHQDGVERRLDGAPGRDVAACGRMRLVAAPHVMNEAPATSLPLRNHHLDAVPTQHAHGRLE